MADSLIVSPSGEDDQDAIQQAINTLADRSIVYLPCGWWKDGRVATPDEIQEIENQIESWKKEVENA